MLKLYDLTIEYKHEPLGLDEVQPRFGWKLESDSQNTLQTAYRLQLSCGGKTVWDSGTVASAQSILIEYLGPNLRPAPSMTGQSRYGTTTVKPPRAQAALKRVF